MKRWLGGMAAAVAVGSCLAAKWASKQMLEGWAGEVFKGAVGRSGPVGQGVLLILVGLALLIVGPDVMIQENRERAAQGRKPRYDRLEFGIVIVGGLVSGGAGVASLLGWA
jgi:hypothetical protein